METKSKLYLRIIGGLIILVSILSFFFSPSYEHFKQGFKQGLYDGQNGVCSTNETVTVKSNSDISLQENSLKKVNLIATVDTIDVTLKGETIYYRTPLYAHLFMFLIICIYSLMLITFIYFLGRLTKGEIFEKSTYKSLNILGFSAVIVPFLEYIHSCITFNTKAAVLQTVQLTMVNSNTFNFCSLLGGLLIIAFAIAFRLGIKIKEENDLTV